MGEKHERTADTEKRRLSALESIDASFAALKKQAEEEKRKPEPYRAEGRSSETMEKINASFAERREAAKGAGEKEDRESGTELAWKLAAGALTVVLVAAVIIFIVMVYQGSSRDGDGGGTMPAVQSTEPEAATEPGGGRTETAEETETAAGTESAGRVIPEEYETILTEEEIEEWKNRETDNSRLFVQMNQKLRIASDKKVYIRLINPPYSAFGIQVKVYTQDDPETVLYQSDILEPGTILEYAEFGSSPEPGQYAAEVEYTVYDKDGNKIGTHEVAVEITAEAQQDAAGQ